MKTFRFSLTALILASLSLLLVLTWLLLSLISFKTAEKDMLAQKSEEGRLLLAAFTHLIADAGKGEVPPPARLLAESLAGEKQFRGILVVDTSGRELYRIADPSPADSGLKSAINTGSDCGSLSGSGRVFCRYSPLRFQGRIAGAARLSLSLSPEYERLARSRSMFLAYFMLDFMLLLGFGGFLLSRMIVKPMRRLLAATKRIAEGDLSCRAPVPGSLELAELGDAFNGMVEALRAKRDEANGHIESLERINSELKTAREEAIRSEKLASVGLLAAGTAHEIGTPLAAILGYTSILREETAADSEAADYLKRMEEEACRIDRIVRGLLDYSRPSAAGRELVDMGALLRSTLDLMEDQGVFRNISVSLLIDTSYPYILGDSHEIQQIFINLFINARDAMPEGGDLSIRLVPAVGPASVVACSGEGVIRGRRRSDFQGAFSAHVDPAAESRYLRIEVTDTGIGIPEENLDRIFDPFFTTKEPGKGTGLGLAVTARIVDTMGGRIMVERVRTGGSRFILLLPAADVNNR
jgi:two-component system, NtrC family, sensor kinase